MESRKAQFGLDGLPLTLSATSLAGVIPDFHFVSILVAAVIKNILHLVANLRRVSKCVKLAHVGKAAHLNRLVQHVQHFEARLDYFFGRSSGGGGILRAGWRRANCQDRGAQHDGRGKAECANSTGSRHRA